MPFLNRSWAVLTAAFLSGCAVFFPPFYATPKQEKSLERIQGFDGLSKETLYERTRLWAIANPDVECAEEDSSQSHLLCHGAACTKMDFGFCRAFDYDMKVDFKDGKMRVRFGEILSVAEDGMGEPNFAFQWGYMDRYFDSLRKDLFLEIENPSPPFRDTVPGKAEFPDDNW